KFMQRSEHTSRGNLENSSTTASTARTAATRSGAIEISVAALDQPVRISAIGAAEGVKDSDRTARCHLENCAASGRATCPRCIPTPPGDAIKVAISGQHKRPGIRPGNAVQLRAER